MHGGRETKPCPYCGEDILAVAMRCKHCQADLSVGRAAADPGAVPAGEALGIAHVLVPVATTALIWLWIGRMNLFTATAVGMTAAIETQKAEIRESLEQGW